MRYLILGHLVGGPVAVVDGGTQEDVEQGLPEVRVHCYLFHRRYAVVDVEGHAGKARSRANVADSVHQSLEVLHDELTGDEAAAEVEIGDILGCGHGLVCTSEVAVFRRRTVVL